MYAMDYLDQTFGKVAPTCETQGLDKRQEVKGTSRGPEALPSHLNDSYYTIVLC